MSNRIKTLIAATALMTLPVLPACAGGSSNTPPLAQIVNGQVNLGNVWSQMNVDISGVGGSVSEAVTAVGNTAQIYTMTDSKVTNNQVATGAIGGKLDAHVSGVGGDVTLAATTVCNGGDISTDPNVTAVTSKQVCASSDPSAAINANVNGVGGNVTIAGATIGNQIEIDTNAGNFPVKNYQENDSGLYTTVNANVANAAGNVTGSATAVGNSAQIVQYSTGH